MLGVVLMGPLPKGKKGNVHLLVVANYFTKWVELFPIRDSMTRRICKILQEEVFTRWGVPKFLLRIYRGPQFLSQLMEDLCKRWGITRKLNTSYPLKQISQSQQNNQDHDCILCRWLAEFCAINTAPNELALGRELLEQLAAHPPNPGKSGYSLTEQQQQQQQLPQDVLKAKRKAHTKQARY